MFLTIPNVVSREQYGPLWYMRWKELQQCHNASHLSTDTLQPGSLGVTRRVGKKNFSFEELLFTVLNRLKTTRKIEEKIEIATANEDIVV